MKARVGLRITAQSGMGGAKYVVLRATARFLPTWGGGVGSMGLQAQGLLGARTVMIYGAGSGLGEAGGAGDCSWQR